MNNKVSLIVKILKDWEIDDHISEHIASSSKDGTMLLLEGLAKEILLAVEDREEG